MSMCLQQKSSKYLRMLILFRYAGQVGFLIAGMKDVTEAQIGDTLYLHNHPVEPLPGFKSAKPMVFAGEELTNSTPKGQNIFLLKVCFCGERKCTRR